MTRRRMLVGIAGAVAAVVLAAAAFLAGPRVVDSVEWRATQVPEDVEPWLAQREAAFPDIRPGSAKGIVWADPATRARTPLAIAYVHGFSAARQEVSPLCEDLAAALGANLFFTRMTGHGRSGAAMAEGSLQAWADDVEEAVAVGRRIGERVVLVATSNGGALATLFATRPEAADLRALVLISPNYGLRDPLAPTLLWPWGPQIGRLVVGEQYVWKPQNVGHEEHWNTRYPTGALVPVMQTVRQVQQADLGGIRAPTLVFYSHRDAIVDPAWIERGFSAIGAPVKRLVAVDDAADRQKHVLAGEILSPNVTARVGDTIREFLAGLP